MSECFRWSSVKTRIVLDSLLPELAKNDIEVVHYRDLDDDEKKRLTKYFDENVYPVLTPLAVDSGHPFPMISKSFTEHRSHGSRRFDERRTQRPSEGSQLHSSIPPGRTNEMVPPRRPDHGEP